MKHIANRLTLKEDRLVFRVQDLDTGQIFTQLKRQNKSCPLNQNERIAYRDHGFAETVKLVRNRRNRGLKDAFNIIDSARYASYKPI